MQIVWFDLQNWQQAEESEESRKKHLPASKPRLSIFECADLTEQKEKQQKQPHRKREGGSDARNKMNIQLTHTAKKILSMKENNPPVTD